MKAIQVMLDEDLVACLDASEEVKTEGRSAVLRRAAAEYLDRRRPLKHLAPTADRRGKVDLSRSLA